MINVLKKDYWHVPHVIESKDYLTVSLKPSKYIWDSKMRLLNCHRAVYTFASYWPIIRKRLSLYFVLKLFIFHLYACQCMSVVWRMEMHKSRIDKRLINVSERQTRQEYAPCKPLSIFKFNFSGFWSYAAPISLIKSLCHTTPTKLSL